MATVKKPVLTNEVFAEKMDALIDKFGRHTLTIIATSNDDVPVTNQEIRIYNNITGTLYATLTYNHPNALTIDLPDGFVYRIVPVVTLASHYCEDIPSGMMTSAATVTLTYKTLGTLSTFTGLKSALNAGLGVYIPMWTKVSYTDTYLGEMTFECLNYNSDTKTMTLLTEYLQPTKQFDAPEALYYAAEELSAGDYSFIHSGTTYYFTLTKAIPAGGQLRATTTTFDVYSEKGGTSVVESGTVSTTAISGATSLGTTGAGVLNHMDRVNYGSNDYGEAALPQWLNADDLNYWKPKTMFDRPPSYVSDRGFMAGIPQEVLNCIDMVDVPCMSQNTYAAPDSNNGKNARYMVQQKFYLPSEMEIFGSSSFDNSGKLFDGYIGAENVDRIKYYAANHTSAGIWWLRTPSSTAYSERLVVTTGDVGNRNADIACGVAVACQVSADAIE